MKTTIKKSTKKTTKKAAVKPVAKPFDPILQVLLDKMSEINPSDLDFDEPYRLPDVFNTDRDLNFVESCVDQLNLLVFEEYADCVNNLTKRVFHGLYDTKLELSAEYNRYDFTIRLTRHDSGETKCELCILYVSSDFDDVEVKDEVEVHTVKEIKAAFNTFNAELQKRCLIAAAKQLGMKVQ
jgi:hypothetical protein